MKSKAHHARSAAMSDGVAGQIHGEERRKFEPGGANSAAGQGHVPARVRALLPVKTGLYDVLRLRSQRDVIRDVMLAAAECGTWLTLAELRALTQYGEASISAQLRHLRKGENGGYDVAKRHREDGAVAAEAATERKEFTWEYRVAAKAFVSGRVEFVRVQERCSA